MKTKMMYLFSFFIGCCVAVKAQTVFMEISDSLPRNVEVDKSTPQTYRMITDYFDYDLQANFIKKARVVGNFTCFLQDDSIKCKDVFISESNQLNNPFPNGVKQLAFENFMYVQSPEILEEKFFSQIPNIDFRLKNHIWDLMGFDVFVYPYWDSLKLNTVFNTHNFDGEVNIANDGIFENKEIQLKWIGVTKFNNEQCAIIKYSQMNGKLKLDLENMSMKGRSHYWGEIYVSLKSKQIEYANLTEDVITDVLFKGQDNHFKGYTVRKIKLEKHNSNENK